MAVVFLVVEVHMIELDVSVLDLGDPVFRGFQIADLRDDFGNTFGAGDRHGYHDEDHGKHHERHEDAACVGEQRHERTDFHISGDDLFGADPGNSDHQSIHGQLHDRRVEHEDLFGLFVDLVNILARSVEAVDLVIFAHERFDGSDAGNVFLNVFVELVVLFEHNFKDRAYKEDDAEQGNGQKDDDDQKDQSDPWR